MPLSRTTRCLLLIVVALLSPAAARAGGGGTSYAFLVGCGNYRKTEFHQLPFTGNDVLGLRDALVQTGFAPENVFVLYDRTPEPERFLPIRAHILQELDLLLGGMKATDTLVVALSGHGLQYKGEPVSYFVPLDGKVAEKETLIALDGPGGLYEKVKNCKARRKLLVVNACRNAPAATLDFANRKVELADEDRDDVPAGIAAIFSCSAGQKSYYDPDRKRALFYDHLIRAWEGEYAGGKEVTLGHVFDEVALRTKNDAHRTLQARQVPQVKRDDLAGAWVVPPTALAAGRQLLGKWAMAEALTPLETAVRVVPHSTAARLARGVAYLRTNRYAAALADLKEAVRLEPESAAAALQLGWMHYYGYGLMPPDYAEALRWFRHAAERGEPQATALVGRMISLGRGTARDNAEAVRWFKKAIEKDEPMAMSFLGRAYRLGAGVARDEAEANRWYLRALPGLKGAGPERIFALTVLGDLYAFGRGVAKDEEEAMRWYLKAARLGEVDAMTALADMYDGRGQPAFQAPAVAWYQKAAKLGDPEAMSRLADLYANGRGIAKDEAEAVQWYRKSADLGSAAGMNGLGFMYERGRGVPVNYALAAQWYGKSADLGNEYAMKNLGWVYQKGLGVPVNHPLAVQWYRKAADVGYAPAMNDLGVMYDNGWGVPKDLATAVRWYRKAADAGEALGMANLAQMYENGEGVPRDLQEAIRWYRRAAERGNDEARQALQRLGAR